MRGALILVWVFKMDLRDIRRVLSPRVGPILVFYLLPFSIPLLIGFEWWFGIAFGWGVLSNTHIWPTDAL